MPSKNRHTVTMEDSVWEWADEFADETDNSTSEVINRAVKVYAGKMAKGEWRDQKMVDEYDQKIQSLTD